MKLRQILSVSALLSAVLFASCSKDDDNNGPQPGEGDKIVAILKADIPYYRQIVIGAHIAAYKSDAKLEVYYAGGDDDYQGQIDILNKLDLSTLKGVLIAPTVPDKLKDAVERIARQLPVVTIDTPMDIEACRSHVGTDNVEMGKKLAASLDPSFFEKRDRPNYIVQIEGNPVIKKRVEGFCAEAGADYKPTVILISDKPEEATAKITAELSKSTGYVRIFASNGRAADYTTAALQKLDRSAMLVGVDVTPTILEEVAHERIAKTIAQYTYGMGFEGVMAIFNPQAPRTQNLDTKVIDALNLNSPETELYLVGMKVPSLPERKIDRSLMEGTFISGPGEHLGKDYPQSDFATITFVSDHEFILASNAVTSPRVGRNEWDEDVCKFSMSGDTFTGSKQSDGNPGKSNTIKGRIISLTENTIEFDVDLYIDGQRVHSFRQIGTKSNIDYSRVIVGTWEEAGTGKTKVRHTYNADGTCSVKLLRDGQTDWVEGGSGYYFLRGNHLAVNTKSESPIGYAYSSGLITINKNTMSYLGVDDIFKGELSTNNEIHTKIN